MGQIVMYVMNMELVIFLKVVNEDKKVLYNGY